MDKARNDLSAAVPKFCLALEEHRRTPDGRVRTAQEFLSSFFQYDDKSSTDRVFKHLPNEVRGPIIAAWGVRGIKAALRDTDDKVQSVIHDALLAGDIDAVAFEEGLTPETLVRWVPLGDLWAFWRAGKSTKQAIHKALTTAYELGLFDAKWFLDTIQAKSSLRGTDVLADGLNKEDLTAWIKRIHETGDGSPKGIVWALGWDKIVNKTQNDALIAVLEAVAAKIGLAGAGRESSAKMESEGKSEPKTDPPTAAVDASARAHGSEKMPVVDSAWSVPPNPPAESQGASADKAGSAAAEDAINIVLEEELLITDSAAPSAPRPPAVTTNTDDDLTQVQAKPFGRDRFLRKR
ncbi:MAG TPA: hypothetical protein VGY54_03960 [Polyangiaceae bacterium]|nr:hypothetical protein [Polyangiaceae bacterium]